MLELLIQLMPPGLWNFEPGSTLRRTLEAIGDELERVRLRGVDLINETDPRTVTETITNWERAVGLPDDRVTSISAVLGERRAAVLQKLTATGGQSLNYFDALFRACGWRFEAFYLFPVLRAGFRCGALAYATESRAFGSEFAYTIQFGDVAPNTWETAIAPIAAADLERVIRHVLHAHTVAIFTYL